MTRKSVIARDVKRQKTVERYAAKRAALKEAFLNPENSYEEKMAAFEKLQKLPRNASPSRVTRRCSLTGRPHAVYRKFRTQQNQITGSCYAWRHSWIS
jgi:small subunit ribosomal protein S14